MRANLLIVSASDFHTHITDNLENHGFTCFFSRGGIRTKEILKENKIEAVVWLYLGHEEALARDLLTIFNQNQTIPIVFVTQSYDELDFAEDIQGLFANLDLNDDLEDFLRTVELACNITPTRNIKERVEASEALPEINFRNAVSQIIEKADESADTDSQDGSSQNITTWHAVDQSEKQILSEPYSQSKTPIFRKVKSWLRK